MNEVLVLQGAGGRCRIAGRDWDQLLMLVDIVDRAGRRPYEEGGKYDPHETGDAAFWEAAGTTGLGPFPGFGPARALRMARDLEDSLDDIPDFDARSHKADDHNAYEWFSGDRKEGVRRFIDFCLAGPFVIS
jgi:hypothetical protein